MTDPADIQAFPPEVIEKIGAYVYRLIDPRSGFTFYVGKGKGNRVFDHARGELTSGNNKAPLSDGDEISDKMKQIREINNAGFKVGHVIHRYGMDDATAFEVEAALIDAYPGLTNIMNGAGSNDFGATHAKGIIVRYAAELAVFQHKALLISVNRSIADASIYDAVRCAWKISEKNAKQAEVVLATVQGIIKGAFVADQWLEATVANFSRLEQDILGRFGFVGREAGASIQSLYVGKRVPEEFRRSVWKTMNRSRPRLSSDGRWSHPREPVCRSRPAPSV